MARTAQHVKPAHFPTNVYSYLPQPKPSPIMDCNWQELRAQLLQQWLKLTDRDLDRAGPNRQHIAQLIERKYGISSALVENYLSNFERTMPLVA